MKYFTFNQADLFISKEQYTGQRRLDKSTPEQILNLELSRFFENYPLFEKYINEFGQRNGLEKVALLVAHGDEEEGWRYYEGNNSFLVQDWINKNDGKYKALLLSVCNPEHVDVKYHKSIIMLPDTDLDFRGSNSAVFTLLVPNVGEIDAYTIGYELKQLSDS